MSVHIDCKGRTILHVKNITCEILYQNILTSIEETGSPLSKGLQDLIEELDLGGYGIGCDIADFIKMKKDVEIFGSLVRMAIDRYQAEVPTLSAGTKERLENFYQELLKYAEELKE